MVGAVWAVVCDMARQARHSSSMIGSSTTFMPIKIYYYIDVQ